MNKDEKKTIYEIYRACRLCGAGAGYKMPIIQNVIQIDIEDEIELRDKIKDCVQIEVNQDDRMPPLICELCVDKVNDFYDFMKLCQQTNKMTRLRLGLPLAMPSREAVQTELNCILGVTETVYVNSDSESEPLSKPTVKSKPKPKSVKMREEAKLKSEIQSQREAQQSRESSPVNKISSRLKRSISPKRPVSPRQSVSPKRTTRQSRCDDFVFEQLQDDLNLLKLRQPPKPAKKDRKIEKETHRSEKPKDKPKETKTVIEDKPIVTKQKRVREVSIDSIPPPVKKNKSEDTQESAKKYECTHCGLVTGNAGALGRHLKNHSKIPAKTPSESEKPKKPGPKSKTVPTSQSKPEPKPKKMSTELKNLLSTPEVPKKGKNVTKEKAKEEVSKEDKAKKKEEPKKQIIILECRICEMAMKNYQCLSHHNMKHHIPAYTPKQQACNPCELWFETFPLANAHHSKHLTEKIPYKCNKCYGEFNDLPLYELHFTNNECLSTYESPDVKCDECWRTFPTYKLLEDHKCPGESARPGGKCSKCNKTYSLLRNQVIHEMKCTGKKDKKNISGEPIETDISSNMLPMEVRLIRCDALLKMEKGNSYNVSTVSHTFGLDRNSIYPYFYSKGCKSETLDAMVSIKDEIKQEYGFVHWDSNDEEDFFLNKTKNVESLTVLSLKTLFSPKCLGKVPRKIREYAEKNYDSVMSINFMDIKSNIDSIIDDLGKELSSEDNYKESTNLFHKLTTKGDVNNVNSNENSTEEKANLENLEDIATNKINIDESRMHEKDMIDVDGQTHHGAVNYEKQDNDHDRDVNDEKQDNDHDRDVNDEKHDDKDINDTNINNNVSQNSSDAFEKQESPKDSNNRIDGTIDKNDKQNHLTFETDSNHLNENDTRVNDDQNEDKDLINDITDISMKSDDDKATESSKIVQHEDSTHDLAHNLKDAQDINSSESSNTIQHSKDLNGDNDNEVIDSKTVSVPNLEVTNNEEIKDTTDMSIGNEMGDKITLKDLAVTGLEEQNGGTKQNFYEKMDLDSQIEEKLNNIENLSEINIHKDVNSSANNSKDNSICDRSDLTEKSVNGDGISLNSLKSDEIRNNFDVNEDTKDLMDQIDAQIGEKEKIKGQNDLRSLDLDTVSDEECNFDV